MGTMTPFTPDAGADKGGQDWAGVLGGVDAGSDARPRLRHPGRSRHVKHTTPYRHAAAVVRGLGLVLRGLPGAPGRPVRP
jgi:hypothetical protein